MLAYTPGFSIATHSISPNSINALYMTYMLKFPSFATLWLVYPSLNSPIAIAASLPSLPPPSKAYSSWSNLIAILLIEIASKYAP